MPPIGRTLLSLAVAEPPHPRTGDPPFGANRGSTATANPRRARQLTSQASRAASRYVVFRSPSFKPRRRGRALGRNLALDLVAATGVGRDDGAHHRPAADDRATRRPRAARPRRARRRRRSSPTSWAPSRAGSGRARRANWRDPRGLGAASLVADLRAADPARDDRRRDRFWLSLSFGGPFHLRLWGAMYPARAARPRASGSSGWAEPRPAPSPPSPAGSSPTALVDRRPSRWPACIGLAVRVGYAGLALESAERPAAFSARESIRALRERPLLGQGRAGPGVLRRRADRGRSAVRARPRRPARPEPGRRRRHRHPGRGRDHDLLPDLGCRRPTGTGARRAARRAAPSG